MSLHTGVIEPYKVRDPRCVRIARDNDVVANVVLLEMVQSTVAVGLVAVPRIVVQRVNVAVG